MRIRSTFRYLLIFVCSLMLALTFAIILLVAKIGYQSFEIKNILNIGYQNSKLNLEVSRLSRDLALYAKVSELPLLNELNTKFTLSPENIRSLSRYLPTLAKIAGTNKDEKYLLVFQNTAEARGTGGILGAFAVVNFKKGKTNLESYGTDDKIKSLSRLPASFPQEFIDLYGQNPIILQNANLSSHLPYSAKLWIGMWRETSGQQLDGVMTIDPNALRYFLKATGPIEVAGKKISASNLIPALLKDAYKEYEFDNQARKLYLTKLIKATFSKFESGNYSKIEAVRALIKSLEGGNIALFASDSETEKSIVANQIGSFLRLSKNKEFRVVIENIDASKLDYYLEKRVWIRSLKCGSKPLTLVSVEVSNTLKSATNLPAYVLTRADKSPRVAPKPGAHRFRLFIYGPNYSRILSSRIKGPNSEILGQSIERKRPILVSDIDLPTAGTSNISAIFEGGFGKATFVDQPLVISTKINIQDSCEVSK